VYKTRTLVLVLRSFLKSLWSLTFSMSGDIFAACRADDTATWGGETDRQRSSFFTVKAKHHRQFKTISWTAWHSCSHDSVSNLKEMTTAMTNKSQHTIKVYTSHQYTHISLCYRLETTGKQLKVNVGHKCIKQMKLNNKNVPKKCLIIAPEFVLWREIAAVKTMLSLPHSPSVFPVRMELSW